ncbi:MAG: carbonic anhydrase [Cyanobacteria bacterium J06626_23]
MKKLMRGIRQFQDTYVPTHRTFLAELAKGQHPNILFITCSDSRIDPELITQADLGELFVIRNAGNIVPPYGSTNGGEGATIEYALKSLSVSNIIVCGHSSCGAMKGLLQIGSLEEKMPLVYNWLKHTEATRQLVEDHYPHLEKPEKLEMLVAENVLTQLENLRTYPAVRSQLHRGALTLHGWIYRLDSGEILAYDPNQHGFTPPFSQINSDTNLAPVDQHLPGTGRLSPHQADRIYRGSAAFSR